MRIGDTEAIYRPEPLYLGNSDGRHEFPFDARIRAQILAVGLIVVLGTAGFQCVHLLMGWAHWVAQIGFAVVFGAGGGAAAAILLTRAYGRFDKPQTRLDYWAEQAAGLLASPGPPAPPVEHVLAARPAAQDIPTGVTWGMATPPSLTEKWNKEN